MENNSRTAYWNEDYVKYWKTKVSETNILNESERSKKSNDITSPDSLYLELIALLGINPNNVVLDVGCGYGRSLPYLSSLADYVIGVDISSQMIEQAKIFTSDIDNIQLIVSESESMNIESNFVDKIICFAAFDAMFQKEALIEFNRITKKGGEVLITGKNNLFFDDDSSAIEAEVGARKKGHPNYFTDVKYLLKNISKFGFEINYQAFYMKRGDFGINKFETSLLPQFYEYCLKIKKIANIKIPSERLPKISDSFSLSYLDTIAK
jgi:ubiquinone/menaquinone biosynthesis C-methylase UbiE